MDAIHLVRHPYNSSATFSPWVLVVFFGRIWTTWVFGGPSFLNIWTNRVWNERIFRGDNSKIWRDARKKEKHLFEGTFYVSSIIHISSTKSKKIRRFLTEVHYLLNSCYKKNWLPGGSTSKTWPKPGRQKYAKIMLLTDRRPSSLRGIYPECDKPTELGIYQSLLEIQPASLTHFWVENEKDFFRNTKRWWKNKNTQPLRRYFHVSYLFQIKNVNQSWINNKGKGMNFIVNWRTTTTLLSQLRFQATESAWRRPAQNRDLRCCPHPHWPRCPVSFQALKTNRQKQQRKRTMKNVFKEPATTFYILIWQVPNSWELASVSRH